MGDGCLGRSFERLECGCGGVGDRYLRGITMQRKKEVFHIIISAKTIEKHCHLARECLDESRKYRRIDSTNIKFYFSLQRKFHWHLPLLSVIFDLESCRI
jgi:hypothetical protein